MASDSKRPLYSCVLFDKVGRRIDEAYLNELSDLSELVAEARIKLREQERQLAALITADTPSDVCGYIRSGIRALQSDVAEADKVIQFLNNRSPFERERFFDNPPRFCPEALHDLYRRWMLCGVPLSELPPDFELELTKKHHEAIRRVDQSLVNLERDIRSLDELPELDPEKKKDLLYRAGVAKAKAQTSLETGRAKVRVEYPPESADDRFRMLELD